MRNIITLLLLILILGCKRDAANEQNQTSTWWKEAIIYQIYPRSFKDTDGDGIGDIKGIIEQLDYVKSLGVTAVWLNPIYTSPNDDNGYDVSDYRGIMADFVTMADFDEMLKQMHSRNIKLIMDIVVNHSSDEHEWFKQSRSSRENPYRDYYHWWPAEKGKPNYRYSLFDVQGDAWAFDSTTNAYYLHYFSKKQPDLNWSNPNVRQEVIDIMKFWAEKGVDGFRLDAFQFAAKDTTYPPFPQGFEKNFIDYYAMQDGLHDYLKEMNQKVFQPYGVMSVSEGAGRNFEDAHALVDEERKELNMAYAFDGVDIAKYGGYDLLKFKEVFSRWDSAFAQKGWLSIFLSNHDQARLVSRFGNDSDEFRKASSAMLQTFILSMRGTPYCYYGDEIGMTNINFESINQYKDIAAINGYKKAVAEYQDMGLFMQKLNFESRDNGRTPMQWDESPQAGFTTGMPWLPVNSNHNDINVHDQNQDPESLLNYFRKMTQLRKDHPALIYGSYTLLDKTNPNVYTFTRQWNGERLLVILNFKAKNVKISLPELKSLNQILINNYQSFAVSNSQATLLPFQAVILKIN